MMPSYPKTQKFEPWEDDGCAGVAEASIWGRVDWTAGRNVIRIMYYISLKIQKIFNFPLGTWTVKLIYLNAL